MISKITNELFLKSIEEYKTVLRKEYIKKLAQAEDKNYAENFYQNQLFLKNEMVPYTTVLFFELKFIFEHYQRLLGIDIAYEKTVQHFNEIRILAKNAIEIGREHLKAITKQPLPQLYQNQIEDKEKQLNDLIEIEEKVLQLTDENLLGALCIHLSGQQLYNQFKQETTEALIETESKKRQFTQNERTLALYILLESLGFRQGVNEDRTNLTALYHLIMDSHFNNSTILKNSNIYKALGSAPDVVNDPVRLKRYLQNIRLFFEKANMTEALKLIDKKIESSKQF